MTTVRKVEAMSDEDLVRTGYAAGFWYCHIDGPILGSPLRVSENILDHAPIDALGKLADG